MKTILTMMSFLLATASYADQCAYVTKEAAEAAVALLKPGSELLHYCEPCARFKPQERTYETVESAAAEETDGGAHYLVALNGKSIDLAYWFIKTNDKTETGYPINTYTNLAKLAGCPTHNVSETMYKR